MPNASKSMRVETVRLLNHAGEYPVTLDRQEFRMLLDGFEAYVEKRRETDAPVEAEEALIEKCQQCI